MSYLDLLAEHGIDGAHPGGFYLTKMLLGKETIGPDTLVLDVGCGTGQTSSYLARKYRCRVVAVDNHTGMLAKARQRFCKEGLDIPLIPADAARLPFRPRSFDLVLAESVTIFTDITRTLREFARVLKPEGILIDIEMTAETPLKAEILKEVERAYGIGRVPTQEEWTGLLQAAGFSGIQILKGSINPLQLLFGNGLGKAFSAHHRVVRRYYRQLGYRVYRCRLRMPESACQK